MSRAYDKIRSESPLITGDRQSRYSVEGGLISAISFSCNKRLEHTRMIIDPEIEDSNSDVSDSRLQLCGGLSHGMCRGA